MFNLIYPFNLVYQKSSSILIKEILWFAPEHGQRRKQSIFVPFFGVNAATSTSTSKLAKLANAVVIPVSCCRIKGINSISSQNLLTFQANPLKMIPNKLIRFMKRLSVLIQNSIYGNIKNSKILQMVVLMFMIKY